MRLLVLMLGALLLTACYEDTDVTMHQAGVYKGSEDNHALSAEERAEILKQRFNSVQTDR
ncbi:hypothetical protein [Methylophaga sp.]|jgi:major membrane immunogen (membrane-anchored lipoprotein)|uniref:hypothetical protein n=1 Tax=Methylophaga sp. TaxID=2024840 RepID=UPI0023B6E1F9|tara:strand:+ start:2363 stop:2542 length:180 start_codon:yes stop_codon:yes gene_type:complete